MKMPTAQKEKFITDTRGRRVGVILDMATYERLREAAEESADLRAYRAAKPKIYEELARGEHSTLNEYRAKRARKGK